MSVRRSVGPSVRHVPRLQNDLKVKSSVENDLKVIFSEGNDLKVKFSEGNDLKVIHTEGNDLRVILSVIRGLKLSPIISSMTATIRNSNIFITL